MNPTSQPTHDDIARQAQRLWQQRGCPEDQHEEIWLEAEDQLTNSPFGQEQNNTNAPVAPVQADTAVIRAADRAVSPVPPQQATKPTAQRPAVRTAKRRLSKASITVTEP